MEGFALLIIPLLQAMPRGQTVAPWACLHPSLQNVQVAQSQVVHQLSSHAQQKCCGTKKKCCDPGCPPTSGTMGCGGENELCTDRMHSLLPMARPVS